MTIKTALAALAVSATCTAAAATTVSFGPVQNLGVVQGTGTAENFYNYQTDGPLKGTFNGGFAPDLELATAYVFLYDDGSDLSLGMVFTGANVADPGTTCNEAAGGDKSLCRVRFSGRITGLANDSVVTVKDDAANSFGDEDTSAPGANGYYELYPFTGTTDGFVTRGVLPSGPLTFDIDEYSNIDTALWVSGPEGALTFTEIDLGKGGTFVSAVPLPAGMWMMLSALGAGGVLRARQTRRG